MRFAPLIRVSTESQKPGEPNEVQKGQIIEAVTLLGGTIPEHCWQYCGQKSATAAEE
jgi:hypothetical protein